MQCKAAHSRCNTSLVTASRTCPAKNSVAVANAAVGLTCCRLRWTLLARPAVGLTCCQLQCRLRPRGGIIPCVAPAVRSNLSYAVLLQLRKIAPFQELQQWTLKARDRKCGSPATVLRVGLPAAAPTRAESIIPSATSIRMQRRWAPCRTAMAAGSKCQQNDRCPPYEVPDDDGGVA